MTVMDSPRDWGKSLSRMKMKPGAHIVSDLIYQTASGIYAFLTNYSDRLSTNGWEGQSLVVTLARTSAPTKPIAGPTRSPPAMIHTGFMSGQSTPPQSQDNTNMPPSPISPESVYS